MRRVRMERSDAGQHLVHDDAKRVNVRAAVDPLLALKYAEVLGRAVFPLPDEDPGLRLVVGVFGPLLGDAEVDDLHALFAIVVARDHQILRADVAVHDAGTMNRLETGESLNRELRRVPRRERSA